MAFTVEDGTGQSTANAYITVQDFKDHHTDRGVEAASDGTYSDVEIAAHIVKATDYIDKRFGRRFKGRRYTSNQALEWPRSDAWDEDDNLLPLMPLQLTKACAEYALLALTLGTDLAPQPDGTAGTVEEKSEKVGPIEESTKYAKRPMVTTGNVLTESLPQYPQADLWIEALIVSQSVKEIERG